MSQNNFICRPRRRFSIAPGCLLLAALLIGLLAGGADRVRQEALAARIAPAVLRFHVLADSDRKEDQEIKLEVRSLILDYLQEHLSPEAGKAETVDYVREHSPEIRVLADQYLAARQLPYRSQLQITNCYFPARSYGSVTFPCGWYDAVRVTLGSGQGHNWWCVLYPRFCFLDAACQVDADSEQTGESPPEKDSPVGPTRSKDSPAGPEPSTDSSASTDPLKDILNEDDYQALADPRPQIQIRFLLPRLLNFR